MCKLILTWGHTQGRERSALRQMHGLRSCTRHTRPTPWNMCALNIGHIRFPFSNFKHFLTLFSKFFASFLHSTCSLSVSRQYLVLDEVHHPIWAAIPSNLTRRKNLYNEIIQISRERDFHPLWCIFPDDLGLWRSREILRQTTIHFPKRNDFHVELFPLRSPLLGESWLVSFPPLNNMLKFSGSSCLIWGRNSKFVVYIYPLSLSP